MLAVAAPEDLPPDLKAFVFTCIDAIEQIDMLVLLRSRSTPHSAQTVAASVGLAPQLARHHLETLVARGLLRIEVGDEVSYRFAPKTDALRGYAERLIDLYRTSRTLVVRAVAQNAEGSLKHFVDAFKLRGKS